MSERSVLLYRQDALTAQHKKQTNSRKLQQQEQEVNTVINYRSLVKTKGNKRINKNLSFNNDHQVHCVNSIRVGFCNKSEVLCLEEKYGIFKNMRIKHLCTYGYRHLYMTVLISKPLDSIK